MLRAHGIENDMESPLSSTNKYPFTRFTHAIRLKELFSNYDTNIIKVRPGQGYAIRRVLGEDSHSTKTKIANKVFLQALMFIINGIVNRDFIFHLPFKNLDVKLKVVLISAHKSKKLFQYHRGRVDPFELGFQMYEVVLEVRYPKRPMVRMSVHVSKHMYDILIKNKIDNLSYENSKILVLEDVVDVMEDKYPDLMKSSIRSCIRHGLNMIFKALIYRCDTYINLDHTNDKFFVYFSGSSNVSQYIKVRKKIRFLLMNKRGKPPHEGWYYFSLTDIKKDLFDEGETVNVNCTRYIEELLTCKQYAKNIYKIKIEDCLRQSLFKEINKTNDSTEYIYRWINNGFESINNTEDCSDRCT